MSFRIIEELINTSGIAPAAKTLYIVAMMNHLPSVNSLGKKTGLSRSCAMAYCKGLEALGWMRLTSHGKMILPTPVIPREVEVKLALEVKTRIQLSPFKGEETSKAFVDWIVAPTVRLIFNARPPFLQNTETGQKMEYDIYAEELRWALEYQGDQHFAPTSQYPGDKQFIERVKRDALKAQLSRQNKVRLSTITKQDLTLERILDAIPDDVPRREFDPNGPFIQMLERLGKEISGRREWDRQ